MTTEEQIQYNALSSSEREDYDYLRRKHPNWSHKQIMNKLAIEIQVIKVLDKGNTDVDFEDPEILIQILKGAKEFLTRVGCFISDFFEAVDDAIDTLTDLILGGISWVGDALSDFWDWLND